MTVVDVATRMGDRKLTSCWMRKRTARIAPSDLGVPRTTRARVLAELIGISKVFLMRFLRVFLYTAERLAERQCPLRVHRKGDGAIASR